jgi:hypothetical protein
MRRTGAVTAAAALAILLGMAGSAEASNLVFVCGKDLCAAKAEGGKRVRLTHDGAKKGGYTRPSVSRAGKRIAYKRGDPGRVWTATLTRKRGRIVGLTDKLRIPAFRDGPRDATQFDVAISANGRRVAWVEIRANVVFGGTDFRRYSARVDGGDAKQVASNGGRPFVGWFRSSGIVREGFGGAYLGMTVDQGLCVPGKSSGTNGTCTSAGARQVAFDPAGRHLRHPSVSPNGKLVVTTAYTHTSDDIDNAIERPGAIALFNAKTAAPIRDLSPGKSLYPSFAPSGRAVAFERKGSVWSVGVKGGKPHRLLRKARQPSWSK